MTAGARFTMKKRLAKKLLFAGLAGFALVTNAAAQSPSEWKDWGGDSARTHYSRLNQITAANVSALKPVWVWDGGQFGRSWEITPLLIVIHLEEFDYQGAAALGFVMLVISFVVLLAINLLQAWGRRRLVAGAR